MHNGRNSSRLNRNNQNRFNTNGQRSRYAPVVENKHHFIDIFVEHTIQSPILRPSIQKRLHWVGNISQPRSRGAIRVFFLGSSRVSLRRVIGTQNSVLSIHTPLVTACKYATIANGGQPLLSDIFSTHFRLFTTRRMLCFGLFFTLIHSCRNFIVELK